MSCLRLIVSSTVLTFASLAATSGAHAQSVRPEIAKPMQQASELLKAGKASQALTKVQEADAVANKNPAEALLIHRMRGAAAQRAGDHATTISSFEAAIASGRLSNPEQAQMAESIAFAYSQQGKFAKVNEWAAKAKSLGGGSPQLNQLLAYAQSQSGDFSAIARDAQAAVTAAEQANRKPGEDDLLRLADAQKQMNNKAGYTTTLEKLVVHYNKKDYWSAHLANLQNKPGFSDRLGLDVMRLRLAQGLVTKADDFMEMAQISLQSGVPAEAKAIMDKGFAAGVLGTGEQAERHKRLQALIVKTDGEVNAGFDAFAKEAVTKKDGNDLVKAGMVLSSRGEGAKGAALIEQGIAKGSLKRPDDAKLRLGLAQLASAATKAKGIATLRGISATDGTSEIARLWALVGG
jgi:tetratricopeptide (TPR) repeat protein